MLAYRASDVQFVIGEECIWVLQLSRWPPQLNLKGGCYMKINKYRSKLALTVSVAMLAGMMATPAFAQNTETASVSEDEIVTVGTRRQQRSPQDTIAPVDIISALEFTQNASTDVQDLLRTSVPSFNVNRQAINDASTISRPANLRGLSPDNTLVLLNGKRRHRGAVITFLGGGISDGAQGVDIASIPASALKQIEVLRDGASSQYGSDAIAGVINFQLNDSSEGGSVEVQYGSTYAGDGDNFKVSGNVGLPLGDNGFLNLTAEYGNVEGTSRSIIRPDVANLIAAGNTAVSDFLLINDFTDEVPQYWGQPDIDDDLKLFFNSGIKVAENAELYAFGGYSERQVTGGFFYRNPINRGGVFSNDGGQTLLVGDLTSDGSGNCPTVNFIDLNGDGTNDVPDPVGLAALQADPDCFSFSETIPSGFTPRFGGNNEDFSIVGGLRGELDIGTGLTYDLSASYGTNRVDFFINNTINASLGPDTPRDFVPGSQDQIETNLNADFVYAVETGLASPLNVAFGAEYRQERFDLNAGDEAAFELGPLADQGFSSGSNGFGGFANDSSATQNSYAAYIDLETDVTEQLTLQGALRYEDFSSFGDTLDYKIAGLFKVNDNLRLRGSISTGFHAPTVGQATITNVTTQINNGVLIDQGTLPFDSAAGRLAADFIESQGNGRPTLGPEQARNITAGIGFNLGSTTWTVDFYDIDVDDRVALGNNVDFLDALNFAGGGANFMSVSAALTALDANGTINRADFAGLDDLQNFRFFTNSFDTGTTGVDIVGNLPFDLAGGSSKVTLAVNYGETEVTNVGDLNPIGQGRINALENLLPNLRGNLSWSHTQGKLRTLVRGNYYGGYDDTGDGVTGINAHVLVDVEAGYEVYPGLELIGGINNLFDTFPPELNGGSGQRFTTNGPFGFNGGEYYVKARYSF